MQFKIVPKKNIEFIVEGEDAGDALVNFATNMDTDMNLYFEAIPVIEKREAAGWEIVKRTEPDGICDTVEIGELNLTSGSVCITDPCYNHDVWCRMNNVPVAPGNYRCVVHYSDEGEWGWRVAKIGIYRDSSVREEMDFDGICTRIGNIGVDAGLAGIFQDKPDFTDEQWSKFCSDIQDGDAWLISGRDMCGFFSNSGFGDGAYDVYAHSCNDTGYPYDGLEIVFLDDEEDDEDDEDDEI